MRKKKDNARKSFPWFYTSKRQSIIEALCSESERAQILVLAAMLDDALGECLRVRFDREGLQESLKNKLLEGDYALLGSFWARIVACRAFGIIDQLIYTVLDAIRSLRNRSAYSDFAVTLTSPENVAPMKTLRDFVDAMLQSEPNDQAGEAHRVWESLRKYHSGMKECRDSCTKFPTRGCDKVPSESQCLVHVTAVWVYCYLAGTAGADT